MSRISLQLVMGMLGFATLFLGSIQLGFSIDSPIYASIGIPHAPVLDSNLRFFGGIDVGRGGLDQVSNV